MRRSALFFRRRLGRTRSWVFLIHKNKARLCMTVTILLTPFLSRIPRSRPRDPYCGMSISMIHRTQRIRRSPEIAE